MSFISFHWGRDIDRLTRLLQARPDFDRPPLTRMSDLDVRRVREPWFSHGMFALNVLDWAVLQAVLLSDDTPTIVEIADLLGAPVFADDVGDSVTRLENQALVALTDAGVVIDPALRSTIPFPGGLGPSVSQVADQLTMTALQKISGRLGLGATPPRKAALVEHVIQGLQQSSTIATAVDGLSEHARQRFSSMVAGDPISYEPGWYDPAVPPSRPMEELAAFGLVMPMGDHRWTLIREAALFGRGGRLLGTVDMDWPPLRLASDAISAQAAVLSASAAIAALTDIDRLLDLIERSPAPTVQTGGVGPGHIKKMAKELQLEPTRVAILLDAAGTAGLVVRRIQRASKGRSKQSPTITIETTPSISAWRILGSLERWQHLVEAWLLTDLAVGAGMRPLFGGTKLEAALINRVDAIGQTVRRELAGLLAQGYELTADDFGSWCGWHKMLLVQSGYMVDALAERELIFCQELGITHQGVAHAAARWTISALLAGKTDADSVTLVRSAIDAWLESSVATFKVQGDMTIVVAGQPTASLGMTLNVIAETVSHGAAMVYRLTEQSLHRGFTRGHSAEDVVEFLAKHSSTAIPVAVSTLIEDAFRRFGRVRVASATCVIVVADELAALDIERSRAAKVLALGLRRISPTVFIGTESAVTTMTALRESGIAVSALERLDRGSVAPEASWPPAPTEYQTPKPAAVRDVKSLVVELMEQAKSTLTVSPLEAITQDKSHLSAAELLRYAQAVLCPVTVVYFKGRRNQETAYGVVDNVFDHVVMLIDLDERSISIPLGDILRISLDDHNDYDDYNEQDDDGFNPGLDGLFST